MKAVTVARLGVALGLVLAIITVLVVRAGIVASRQAASHPPQTTEVVVSQSLPADTVLGPDNVLTRPVTIADLPPGAATRLSQVAGRVTQSAMVAGEPVLSGLLYPSMQAAGLAARVPRGQRIMELPVNVQSGVGGMLEVGNRVDVLVNIPGSSGSETTLLLEDIPIEGVLSASGTTTTTGQSLTGYSGVLIQVSDRQAAALFLAESTGSVQLLMRGIHDRGRISSLRVTSRTLRRGVVLR